MPQVRSTLGVGTTPRPLTRGLTVIAQDPSITDANGKILRAVLQVPAEPLAAGPCGHRVQVVDYDASTDVLYRPQKFEPEGSDPFAKASDAKLLGAPGFHAQNVYAIVMCTLSRFEYALGRRVPWGFPGHQLKVAPHAFNQANAFYSGDDEALLFGYFTNATGKHTIFSCLSHDVVAHETTHALVDGLRPRYTEPSSPDQAAFHEGFADVIAILSVFSQRAIVDRILDAEEAASRHLHGKVKEAVDRRTALARGALRESILFAIGKQMGKELQSVRGNSLRHSVDLRPSEIYIGHPEYREPHRRGEIFVAALLQAFAEIWEHRILSRGTQDGWKTRNRSVESEEGAEIADRLLKIAIRALDYSPPVDLQFDDYLSALLTIDTELYPQDDKYDFRNTILRHFAAFGIEPVTPVEGDGGRWIRIDDHRNSGKKKPLVYDGCHFESLQHDPGEAFRFIWQNRESLELYPGSYCRVASVRPASRQGPDGFFLRETVTEYVESIRLRASELPAIKLRGEGKTRPRPLRKCDGMPEDTNVTLYGGGILIFDEFGRVKFHIKNRIDSMRQQSRLQYLWDVGFFDNSGEESRREVRIRRGPAFSTLHLRRATAMTSARREGW